MGNDSGKKDADITQRPTREMLDFSLGQLPGAYRDPDYCVKHMRSYWGDVFTDADEVKVRELVKKNPPPPPEDVSKKAAVEPPAPAPTTTKPYTPDPALQGKRYGWRPDQADPRDRVLEKKVQHHPLPSRIDLRHLCPPVYDQGDLGSCTANAIAGAIQYERRRQALGDDFVPSRLFIYYNERAMEDSVNDDAGAAIRDGIKSVSKLGNCPETLWPYDVKAFAHKPGVDCYAEAANHKALDYWRVPRSLTQMRGCLWAGFPFVFGFEVYQTFESEEVARTGLLAMPSGDEVSLGGHAVMCVGYDNDAKHFIVRNSWGEGWGDKGYFYMPYDYLMDEMLSSDFWCIKVVAA